MTSPLPENLLLLGVSHQSTPIAVRESCSVAAEKVPGVLRELKDEEGVFEACLLSTCNRTELLVAHPEIEVAEGSLRSRLFHGAESAGGPYVHRGLEAVFHVFSVAAGVDSMVIGESEILRQLKKAHALARDAGTCDRLLDALLQQSLSVGKRVRRDTCLGEGTLSIAKAAVELAHKVFGAFERVCALIIGVGETGQLVARHLQGLGVGRLIFANRSRARAEAAAKTFGGEVLSFDEIASVLSDVNLSIVSVEAPEPVVRAEDIDRNQLRGHDRPPMIIDLSVPRGVAAEVAEIPDLLCYGLDDLEQIIARHRADRMGALADTERILVEEAHKFLALRTYASMKPSIARMGERFSAVESEFLAGVEDPDGRLAEFSRRLSKRLLAVALEQLKDGARHTRSEEGLRRQFANYQKGRMT